MTRRPALLPAVPAAALALLLAGCETTFQPTSTYTPELPGGIDADHYSLEVELYPERRRIEAVCTVRLRPAGDTSIDTVRLDLEGLEVYSVKDEAGKPLEWEHEGGELLVDLRWPLDAGEELELEVAYGGRPAKGLWFAGDAEGEPSHVFTQGQCEDSRWWFPCNDIPSDRATSEVTVTMPVEWVATAAGERVERTEDGDTAVEHWRMATPHPAYLTTLVAGDLVVREGSWEDVPLTYLAPESHARWMEPTFAETGRMLGFFSGLTGIRYPYAKYSQAAVENFPFGGMENISATTLTVNALKDERGRMDREATKLIAHEAAHQWFGNLLTCADWSHIWLNEGFATYMEALYLEGTRGLDAYRVHMQDMIAKYVEADQGGNLRPIVHGDYEDPIDLFFDGHVYPGGASRLHLLRFVLGDDDFFRGLRTYTAENVGRSVVTDDFQHAMEKVSGKDLDGFFEQWIHGVGHPEFLVSWKWNERTGKVTVSVTQRQSPVAGVPSVFETPVLIEVRDRRGNTLHRVEVTERNQRFELPSQGRPVWVRFDKYGWIPKELDSRKTYDEWLAILTTDDDVNGRRMAARMLGTMAADQLDFERKEFHVAELVGRLRTDDSEAVRVAAAEALGVAGGLEARARLMKAARSDVSPAVRVAALDALASFGLDADLARFADEVFEERFTWKTMGAAAGLYAAADPSEAYRWLTTRMLEDSPNDALRVAIMPHLGGLDDEASVDQMVDWMEDESASSAARVAAARQLGESHRGGAAVSEALAELLEHQDYKLRRAAISSLAKRAEPAGIRALEVHYDVTIFPRERRTIEAAMRRDISEND
jgi:aminopeptidase N